MSAAAATALVPAPAAVAGVVAPYAVVAPYWKAYVVARPRGSTVPVSVAEVGLMRAAPPVVAAGAVVAADAAAGTAGTAEDSSRAAQAPRRVRTRIVMSGAFPVLASGNREECVRPVRPGRYRDGAMPTVEGLTLSYALYVLPPGRFPFRRWRWELWHGAYLVAAGWRTSEPAAERAVRAHAGDFGHRLFGLRPPPRGAAPGEPLRPGAAVLLQAGAVALTLVPRALEAV